MIAIATKVNFAPRAIAIPNNTTLSSTNFSIKSKSKEHPKESAIAMRMTSALSAY